LTTFTDARAAWAMRHANPPERAWTEAGKGHFHRIRCSTIAPTSLPARVRPGDGKTHHESVIPGPPPRAAMGYDRSLFYLSNLPYSLVKEPPAFAGHLRRGLLAEAPLSAFADKGVDE